MARVARTRTANQPRIGAPARSHATQVTITIGMSSWKASRRSAIGWPSENSWRQHAHRSPCGHSSASNSDSRSVCSPPAAALTTSRPARTSCPAPSRSGSPSGQAPTRDSRSSMHFRHREARNAESRRILQRVGAVTKRPHMRLLCAYPLAVRRDPCHHGQRFAVFVVGGHATTPRISRRASSSATNVAARSSQRCGNSLTISAGSGRSRASAHCAKASMSRSSAATKTAPTRARCRPTPAGPSTPATRPR